MVRDRGHRGRGLYVCYGWPVVFKFDEQGPRTWYTIALKGYDHIHPTPAFVAETEQVCGQDETSQEGHGS